MTICVLAVAVLWGVQAGAEVSLKRPMGSGAGSIERKLQEAYDFTLLPGRADNVACSGRYAVSGERDINGQPVFMNREKNRFLAWNGEVGTLPWLESVSLHVCRLCECLAADC